MTADPAAHPTACADAPSDHRVVITGAGLVTCHGLDLASTWRAIVASREGFGPMSEIESALPPGSDGGQAPALPDNYHPDLPREARYLRWTVDAALADAGYGQQLPVEPHRAAVMLGTTLHGMRAGGRFLRSENASELSSFLAGDTLRLAFDGLGVAGSTATTCSACSSSLGSIALAATMLAAGEADLVIAGGYDTISEYVWGGFNALRLVADGPPMPFCRNRPGMKLAEGYGIVVLERAADAAKRSARTLAVISGWGESSDAYHLTRPHPQGEGAARAMQGALCSAGVQASEIDLAVAHATGTQENDAAEFAALSQTFGQRVSEMPTVAFKSHLGHTLGGAGAIEMILSALALREGIVPTTARVTPEQLEFPDLNLATGRARRTDAPGLRHAISVSLGFGGANTSVVLSRPDAAPAPKPAAAPDDVAITSVGVILPDLIGNEAFLARLSDEAAPGIRDRQPPRIDPAQLGDLIDARRTRRMSPYVRLTLAVVRLALAQAGLLGDPDRLRKTAGILGTTHGSPDYCYDYYAQIVREGVKAANPMLFAEGVPNAAAAQLSLTYGLGGSCQTIIGSRTAGLDALRLAASRIRQGHAERIIVAAAEDTHPSLDAAYRKCGLQRTSGGDGGGFVPSTGAVSFLLESRKAAEARGAKILATLGQAAAFNEGPAHLPRSVRRLLATLPHVETLIGSLNDTRIDKAERVAVGRSARMLCGYESFGELFSVTPLVGLAATVLGGALPEVEVSGGTDDAEADKLLARADNKTVPTPPHDVAVICTDWSGPVAGAIVQCQTLR